MNDNASFHILHFIASLQGGAAHHVLHLCKGLKERGHKTSVVAPEDNPALQEVLRANGIEFIPVDFYKTFSRKTLQGIRTLLASSEYSHFHLHGHRAAAVVRLASTGQRKKAPILYTVHGYHPMHYKTNWTKKLANELEKFFEPKIDCFISVSESTRQELIQNIPKIESRCTVIHNGIPFVERSVEERKKCRETLRQQNGFNEKHFVIGTVARLQWQKSVHRLLQAFGILQENYPDFYLLLIGSGPEKEDLERLANDLKIHERVKFLGDVADTRPYYCMMDLFVLPSLWEGLPLTVLEAWDAEVPVVVTNVSGSRDLIDDGETGFLATNTATGISQGIIRSFKESDDFSHITKRAKNLLKTEYSLNRMVEETEQIYRQVLSRKIPHNASK